MNASKCIFLDRDGVINEMVYDEAHGLVDSPRNPEQVQLVPGIADFMRWAREQGFRIAVVTNQPGLAKGTLTEAALEAVHQEIENQLNALDAKWDHLLYCPHHPVGTPRGIQKYIQTCDCRKPAPGMILQGLKMWNINPSDAWMIGDGLNDVQAGNRAGCNTILFGQLKPYHADQIEKLDDAQPDFVCADWAEIRNIIQR